MRRIVRQTHYHLVPAIFTTSLRAIRSLRHIYLYGSVCSDATSLGRLLRGHFLDILKRATPPQFEVRTRQLGGLPITVRAAGTDMSVHLATFHGKFHAVDYSQVPRDAKVILDLGANIGCTAAHFACLYPQAKIIAVEMDADNAYLARQNTAHWRDRCTVVEAAIWHTDGSVEYQLDPLHADGFSARDAVGPTAGQVRSVQAISVNTLLNNLCPGQMVDYAKIDIEGAERELLKTNTEWLRRVRCLKVELHGGYTKEECAADLKAAGFNSAIDSGHWACVLALNPM